MSGDLGHSGFFFQGIGHPLNGNSSLRENDGLFLEKNSDSPFMLRHMMAS